MFTMHVARQLIVEVETEMKTEADSKVDMDAIVGIGS